VTNPKNGAVVAVINMKGGVGKTILSGNLFREVCSDHKIRTLLVDFDAQFNLSQLLLTRSAYESLRDQRKTIFSIMESKRPETVFEISENDLEEVGAVDDFTVVLESNEPDGAELRMLPGDFRLALLNLRETSDLKLPDRRFKKFIAKAALEYGLVVLDCNPSSSFTTRCALEVATHIVIPVRADKFAMLGVELLLNFIESLPTLHPLLKINLILNDVQEKSDQDVISFLRGHKFFGPRTLVSEIRSSRLFMTSTDYTGFSTDKPVARRHEISDLLKQTADELAKAMGIIP
jgi:chromosome partitioning protein